MTTLESLEARVEQLEADIPTRRGCVTHLEGLQRTQRYTNDRLSALDLRMSNVEAKRGEPAYPVQTTNLAHEGCDEDLRDMGRKHGRLLAGVAAVVMVAAITFVLFGLRMSPLSGEATSGRTGSIPDRGLDSASGRIAFSSDRDGDSEIYVVDADGTDAVQLTSNDSDERYPAWSPDGERIAFASDRDNDDEIYDLYVMNADGTGVEQLTDGCSNIAPAWSPDGERIAFQSRGDVYVMDSDGTGVEQLTGNPRKSCAQMFVSDRDGEPAWYVRNADGSIELFTDYDSVDNWESVDAAPKWSPDGNRIAFVSGRGGDGLRVHVMNADGSGAEQLTGNDNIIDAFMKWLTGNWSIIDSVNAWSPDGGRIAFYSGRDSNGMEIYVMNADGTDVERLTENGYPDVDPAWSPDGGRIAFDSARGGAAGIYVMNVDGSGVQRLTEGHSPSWSP